MTCQQGWCLAQRLGLSGSDAELLYFAGSITLAIVLAVITACAVQQNRRMVNEMRQQRAENRVILQYERRAAILRGALRCCGLIERDGSVPGEAIPCWLEATSERDYLLNTDLCRYLEEIYRKVVEAYTTRHQWEGLPVGAERSRLVHRHAELILWLTEQPRELRQRFLPHLRLEEEKKEASEVTHG